MANIPSSGGTSPPDNKLNSAGITNPFSNPKDLLALALGVAIILMLADFFPRVAIGFMLLVLASVIIYHYDIVTSFLNGL